MNVEKNRIGLVIDNIHSGWAQSVWTPYIKSALKMNKSLFVFPGGWINTFPNSNDLRNCIYSLVNTENLDGLISWSASLKGEKCKEDDFKQFHFSFDPLPYITVGYKMPSHPIVDLDGYTGIKLLLTHCIKVHGARKIAFLQALASHEHVIHRIKGYNDALKEAGLPVEQENPLITDPFPWDCGDLAAAQLFKDRKLIPGKDFDTLIGSNDLMAIKAINYFSGQGYYVPSDYHVLGFDNSLESRLTESPLSTVMAPYFEMSNESMRVLIKLIENNDSTENDPSDDILLPSKPIIRESCGCSSLYHIQDEQKTVAASLEPKEETLTMTIGEYLQLEYDETITFVKPLVRSWYKISEVDSQTIISPFHIELFFKRLDKALSRFFNSNRESELLFKLLKDLPLSGLTSPSFFRKYEPSILRVINRVQERLSGCAQFERENLNKALNTFKHELLGTRDRKSLIENLALHLPRIGINTAGLALYYDDNTSLWVGGFSLEGIHPVKEQFFPRKHLVPESLRHLFSQGIFAVQPLFTEKQSLGFFIHTVPDFDGVILEDLRTTISFALKGIFQFEEVVKAQEKMLESIEQSRLFNLQKEAAQAASEAKSQFLAKVSHEIRTPMNAVLGMSELLLSENLNKRQRQYVEDIKSSAMDLLEIINEILDLSKIQSGNMNLNPVHYNFITLIDNVTSMMKFLIKNKEISFSIDIQGDMPKYLYGDNIRLRQILLNLLSNAVKFTKTGYVYLSLMITDENIHFAVKDTGIGIKPEDFPSLFEAFRQIETTKIRDVKGTGLGLSITKALIEMMGGNVEVESVYGQGSTFHVIVPKVFGNEEKVLLSDSAKRVLCPSDTRILVVDDNKINLNVISGLLKLSNVTVFTATSGQAAIEMIRCNQYELVFMDHMMPEMDGIEAMKNIRNLGIKTPVIALTANAVTSAKEMLLSSGMDDFLSKPIIKEELNEILIKWIPGVKLTDPIVETVIPDDSEDNEKPEFWEKINQIEEITVQIGLERVSEQRDVYQNTLKILIKQIEKCAAKLKDFLALDDMQNFAIEAHSMKSSLANVGAMDLSRKADELEVASSRNDSDYCTSSLQFFLDELQNLSVKLKEAFLELLQNDDKINITSDLALILTKIKEGIKEMKYVEINNELKQLETLSLSGVLKDEIEEIKEAIIMMDYDSTLEIIDKLFCNA